MKVAVCITSTFNTSTMKALLMASSIHTVSVCSDATMLVCFKIGTQLCYIISLLIALKFGKHMAFLKFE